MGAFGTKKALFSAKRGVFEAQRAKLDAKRGIVGDGGAFGVA